MKNLLLPILILVLTIGFGCKNPFQEKSVVGKWKAVKTYDPNKGKWEDEKKTEFEIEFLQDGRYADALTKPENGSTYKVNNSVEPNQISVIHKGNKEPITFIYKFQGERLIMKMAWEAKYGVAKDFSIEPNFGIVEFEKK